MRSNEIASHIATVGSTEAHHILAYHCKHSLDSEIGSLGRYPFASFVYFSKQPSAC